MSVSSYTSILLLIQEARIMRLYVLGSVNEQNKNPYPSGVYVLAEGDRQ